MDVDASARTQPAQLLTANRNTQVRGRTPSYDLRFRRATADPLYVVYLQTIEPGVPAAVNSRASAMLATGRCRKGSLGSKENPKGLNTIRRNKLGSRRKCLIIWLLKWDSNRSFNQLRIMMAQRSGSIIHIILAQAKNQ